MRGADTDLWPLGRAHEPTAGLYRIVVALDGTPFAEAALAPAVALGRAVNAEIVLVRAHEARTEPVPSRLGLRRHERETLARASLYLARIEQDLRARGVRAVGISPVGRATDAITEVARRDGDLVVLATHAGAGSGQVSVARELSARVAVPLLLLSPAAKGVFMPAVRIPTMVVALDGERHDVPALRLVTTLARSFDARVVAVGSTHSAAGKHEPGRPGGQVAREHHAARVTAYLETVRCELAHRGVAAWTAVVESDPTAEIAEIAALVRTESDLVALVMRGTLARREATVEAALALLRSTGAAVLLIPQEPLLTLVPGGSPARLLSGGIR